MTRVDGLGNAGMRQEKGKPEKKRSTGSLRLSVSVLLAFLSISALSAASVLDFPRFSLDPEIFTGIAILNPNQTPAQVTLTAYGNDGQVLGVREVEIPAGSQISRLLQDLFAGQIAVGANGWLQAFSMSSDLSGFFLVLDATGAELDGAELPPRANRLAFNQISAGGGASTELNLVNTGGEAVTVDLTLVGATDEPVVRQTELATRGVARLDVAEFFGVQDVPTGAFVLAQASQDLVGFELVRSPEEDSNGLRASNADEFLNSIYFTQFSVLGPFITRLGLVNHSDRAVIVSAAAHAPDGTLFSAGVTANPVTLSLDPGQSVSRDLVELFGFTGDEPLEGWLEVTSTSAAINGYLEFNVPATGAAATMTPVAQGSLGSAFAHLATTRGFFTGLAVLNSATLAADVRVAAQSADGRLLGTYDTVLQPGQRFSDLITELIPDAADQAGGLVFVRSNVPVFSSALFGTSTVLSNIPGQPVPEGFNPDAAVARLQVQPRLAILQTGGSQTFAVSGLSGAVDWGVDGTAGGSAQTGTITGAGVYTGPVVLPSRLPVVVTALSGSQSAGGSVDLVSPQIIAQGIGLVQSLAFLNSLQRLFTAELGAIVAASDGTSPGKSVTPSSSSPSQGLDSAIFGMGDDGARQLLVTLLGEEVPKMIPFPARDGREYLLVAGQSTGRVLRVDPTSGVIREIAANLEAPSALVLDPVTGNLLVAESTQVTSIPRRDLESDLTSVSSAVLDSPTLRTAVLVPLTGISGLAVDSCTGKVYLSQRGTGRLLVYTRETGEVGTVVEGLNSPGQLAGIYRARVSCPDAFQLLIVEEGADQVVSVLPATGEVISPWIPGVNLDDIVLVPEDGPFQGQVFFDDQDGDANNSLISMALSGLYGDGPINPPQMELTASTATPPGPDLSLSSSTAAAGTPAVVKVLYRPGDPDGAAGGSDQTNILVFTIDYDQTRLRFDPTDSNSDGVPDSVLPNTPSGFRLFTRFDPNAVNAELGFVVLAPSGLSATLPSDSLMSISFQVLPTTPGTAAVRFAASNPPQAVDSAGNGFPFDEVIDGSVAVTP